MSRSRRAARDRKVDGVICGHTHNPDHRMIGPILYINDGDWVQSRTALVEEPAARCVCCDGTRFENRIRPRRLMQMSRFYPVQQLFAPEWDRSDAGLRELASRAHQSAPRKVDLIFFDAGGGHRASATALQSMLERDRARVGRQDGESARGAGADRYHQDRSRASASRMPTTG